MHISFLSSLFSPFFTVHNYWAEDLWLVTLSEYIALYLGANWAGEALGGVSRLVRF
jgi:hypothetical protein